MFLTDVLLQTADLNYIKYKLKKVKSAVTINQKATI